MNQMMFVSKEDFREWLSENCACQSGMWLIFGKASGPITLNPNEALEEALCFGWIDGLIKTIDEKTYQKYFSPRRHKSKWSERNKNMVANLEMQGRMTEFGRARIEEAKRNGSWDVSRPDPITEEQLDLFTMKIKDFEPAYSNFLAMSRSIRRAYAGLYLDTKSEQTRIKRLNNIIERLNKGLKPMEKSR